MFGCRRASSLDKGGLVIEVFQGEEITCRNEEQGHVELEDELTQPAWCLGVGNDHQNDGDTFTDRDDGFALHGTKEQTLTSGRTSL